ncbi:restriction endonuclease subunit S [Dermabacter hominis]|mgnify:CR=1 FL=1|uniref:restriction endonuclease subunit S n=1 Tax=Dermabacter hominis TaxID=36740 RepID=UPI00242C8713|nr:restriction endonuclease subunit S [Dermabacter hominis]
MTEVGLWHYAYVNPGTPEFSELSPEKSVPFLPLEAIWPHGTADFSLTIEAGSGNSYTQFRKGDVLVPKVTPTVFHGRAMVAEVNTPVGLATSEVHVLRARHNADPRWLMYQMLTNRFLDRARGNITGVAGLQRISTQYLESYKVQCTSLATQRRIADYLDEEVREMDALIAELQRLVVDLSSRRTKLVEEACVQGAEGKARVGLVAKFVRRGISPSYCEEAGLRVINQKCVRPQGDVDFGWSRLHDDDSLPVSEVMLLRAGDILINSTGTGTLGRVAFVREKLLEPTTFDSHVTLVRPDEKKVNPSYLAWMIHAQEKRLIDLSVGSTNQIELSRHTVMRLEFPLPPLERQREIADELDRETAEMDFLIKEATELIENLKARKTALITEVVTGRKKV